MPKLEWDKIGERLYETGVDQVALFPISANNTYDKGYAWNGVTAINETPDGGEPTKLYADNIQYLTMYSVETLGGTITAYQSPEEFDECDGSAEIVAGVKVGQQARKTFGLAYRTMIGNDTQGTEHGYMLHLLYGCMASPSDKEYSTINDSPEAADLSWEFTTTPVAVTGKKPTALVLIDSTKVDHDKLVAFEKILYGDENTDARLPLPDEIKTLFS